MSETLKLEAFLAGLGPEDADAARVAATRIDALEREIGPPGWIERNLGRLTLVTLVLFVIGAGGLFGVFSWGRAAFGLGGVTLMVSGFPALMLGYLLSVRGRTRADHEKMELNERYFLPHGGIYFGAAPGDSGPGGGKVVRVDWKPGEKNLREQVEARYDAAMKWRW